MFEVRQEDRDAAAAYWKQSRIGNAETQRRYLSGEADAAFIVQAFARHREAAEARTVAAIVAWLRGPAGEWSHPLTDDAMRSTANAIERGEWREPAR